LVATLQLVTSLYSKGHFHHRVSSSLIHYESAPHITRMRAMPPKIQSQIEIRSTMLRVTFRCLRS
jgi:hypothetical protein